MIHTNTGKVRKAGTRAAALRARNVTSVGQDWLVDTKLIKILRVQSA